MMKTIVCAQAASMGELLKRAGMNTLMGMGTVFIVLILISVIIYAFGLIGKWQSKKNIPSAGTAEKILDQAEDRLLPEENLCDDLELVAVITAAIAASEDIPADGLVVRSIRRRTSGSYWKKG